METVVNYEEVVDKMNEYRKHKIGFTELRQSFEKQVLIDVLDYIIGELDEKSSERDKFIYMLYMIKNH